MQAVWERISERTGDLHDGVCSNREIEAATIAKMWARFEQLEEQELQLLRPGLMLRDDDTARNDGSKE